MRNFLLAMIVMLFFAVCPAFAQCANGVCRAPQRGFTFQQQTFSGGCANGQCAAPQQQDRVFASQRTTVMTTHMPVRNAVRVRFMPFRRLFR